MTGVLALRIDEDPLLKAEAAFTVRQDSTDRVEWCPRGVAHGCGRGLGYGNLVLDGLQLVVPRVSDQLRERRLPGSRRSGEEHVIPGVEIP